MKIFKLNLKTIPKYLDILRSQANTQKIRASIAQLWPGFYRRSVMSAFKLDVFSQQVTQNEFQLIVVYGCLCNCYIAIFLFKTRINFAMCV